MLAKLALLLLLIGIALYFLFGPNAARLDKDPVQRRLATLMLAAALGHDADATHALRDYLAAQGWQRGEAQRRIRHAVTLTRAQVPDDVYARIEALGQYILDRNSTGYRISD